jgi:hypothetical protein
VFRTRSEAFWRLSGADRVGEGVAQGEVGTEQALQGLHASEAFVQKGPGFLGVVDPGGILDVLAHPLLPVIRDLSRALGPLRSGDHFKGRRLASAVRWYPYSV